MEVPKESMIDAHPKYAREKRLKEHYEGLSKHVSSSEGGGGHDNLELLVNDPGE